MEKLSWIKELVKAEQQMEESGMVDITFGFDPDKLLVQESLQFLMSLKDQFIDAANAFNDLKASALGRIKIYGIAKTHADFMLFRNGFKMIFSLKAPGVVSIRFNFMGSSYLNGPAITGQLGQMNFIETASAQSTSPQFDEQFLEAKWGPFEEIIWQFQGHPFKPNHLVRHYLSRFIKESTK